MPEQFRSQGYETHISGKWHNDLSSLTRSFESGTRIFHGGMCDHDSVPLSSLDDFANSKSPRVESGFSTELFTQATCEFLESRNQDRPFFAWLSLTSPHDPRTPPKEFLDLYNPENLLLPENFSPEHPFDNGELFIRDEMLLPKPLDPDELKQEIAAYYGMITHQDREIGKVLATLERSGELSNTIIVYLSDHGLALGRHGLLGKQNLYEHSIRIPLVISGSGVPINHIHEGCIYSLDLPQILYSLVGLSSSAETGNLSTLTGSFPSPDFKREAIFALYKDVQRSVRAGNWKLIVYAVESDRRIQLFNLENDPHEKKDLASDSAYSDLIRTLSEKLKCMQECEGDPHTGKFHH